MANRSYSVYGFFSRPRAILCSRRYIMATRSPVEDVHILWITAGLSCDGDTISVTAAMQPSVEDVLMGAIPGLPKVHLHNPVLAYEQGGDSFMTWWYKAERGEIDPLD